MTMMLNSLSAKHFLIVLVSKPFYKTFASVRQQTHDSLQLSTFTRSGLFISMCLSFWTQLHWSLTLWVTITIVIAVTQWVELKYVRRVSPTWCPRALDSPREPYTEVNCLIKVTQCDPQHNQTYQLLLVKKGTPEVALDFKTPTSTELHTSPY